MKPIISYLIIIGIQVIASWEYIKLMAKELKDEDIMFGGSIILLILILFLFNMTLYKGGFYRLPWGW